MRSGPKHCHARVTCLNRTRLFKLLSPAEAAASSLAPNSILLWDEAAQEGASGEVTVSSPKTPDAMRSGDVVRLSPGSSLVQVLYRRGSTSNVLFATERCNSLCLMCSQPPRDVNDDWRVRELLDLIGLIDDDETQLGITGGEPTLLGPDLARLLRECRVRLPQTHLHVLTNGRAFREPELAAELIEAGGPMTTWAVPLAGPTPLTHDEIMGAPGGFRETLLGLAEMARLGANVEIRVVLHALSIQRLLQLTDFIYRRLPFVEHVALMGLEPMGYAKTNWERLWMDPLDYAAQLSLATRRLSDRGIAVSVYNLPLCVLPREIWAFAKQSISDWKNAYAPECDDCAVRNACAGYFASAGQRLRSRGARPIDTELLDEMA